MKTQQIEIVGKEFSYDFYEANKDVFHMLRFVINKEERLEIIKYNHRYQKTPMVVVGVATCAGKMEDNHNWMPCPISIEALYNVTKVVNSGLWKAIKILWEDEIEESFEEVKTYFYNGECELIVTTRKVWSEMSNIVL
jgi:hypothetical protein